MKIAPLAALLVLASCATTSGAPALESRLSSWEGSSIDDLARELGEPAVVSDDSWEWRFSGPGMQAATSTSSLPQPVGGHNQRSSTGHASSPGVQGKSWTRSIETSVPRKECAYRAKLDGATIVEVETLVVSGRCQFREIPLQAKK